MGRTRHVLPDKVCRGVAAGTHGVRWRGLLALPQPVRPPRLQRGEALGAGLHGLRTRPHFVAYGIRDLPAAAPFIARAVFGLPLLTWTVRSDDDRGRAARWADQIIFERIRP